MKKILCFVLCLMLACGAVVSLAEDALIPSIKIQRQMQNDGNGMKGSFRIDAEGMDACPAELLPLMAALRGAEFDILRNAHEASWHLTAFQQDEAGQQTNRTELYQAENGLFVRSDFLPGRVFRIPTGAELIPASFSGTGENPFILDTAVSFFGMTGPEKTAWDTVADKYSRMVEAWLAGFAREPELMRNADGTVQMKLIYVAPVDEIRKEMVALVKAAATDPDLAAMAGTVMSDEQRAIYLNAGLEGYYSEVMNGIDLQGEIRFEKEVTTLGEMTASALTLPLDPAVTGYRTAEVFTRDGQTGYTLSSDTEILRIIIPEFPEEIMGQAPFDGSAVFVRKSTADAQGNLAVRVDIRKSFETYTDEETERIHEIHHFVITASRDTGSLPEGTTEEDFPAWEDRQIVADLHFSGKAPQSSPVTLEAKIDYTRGGFTATLSGKVKTAATWAFVPFSADGAEPLGAMSQESLAAALAQWIGNAAAGVRRAETAEGATAE